jgi:diguanylate cyclase (GGDEF)-like protein
MVQATEQAHKEKALAELLAELFGASELRAWMRLEFGAQVAKEMPGDGVSLETLAFEVVMVLGRHGLIQPALFDALSEKRPGQLERIAAVAGLWNLPESRITTIVRQAMPRPVPDYPDDQTRLFSQELEKAHARKRALERAEVDTAIVVQEILTLKRAIREGGQLKAGDSLGDGRYLLLRPIDRGGFAVVWEALDSDRQRRVAIKVLHTQFAHDAIRRKRFFRGARAMAELEHDAVVDVLEPYGEDSGYYFFVMEYVAGGNLNQAVLEDRHGLSRMPPSERLQRIILPVAMALAKAHEKGMVHRDVKPHNVLLTDAGRPKLTDFDLVRADDTTGGTRTGAMGTLLYSAPEVLDRPQDADARADVYGLGMTAIFMLHATNLSKTKLRHLDELITNLPCDHASQRVLARAVEWEADKRFATIGEFCDALRRKLEAKEAKKTEEADSESLAEYTGTPVLVGYKVSLNPSKESLEACIIVTHPPGPDIGKRTVLERTSYIVGRDASADLVINHKAVSRNHARLIRDDNGRWQVVDLGSTNGTFIYERKVERERHQALYDGDIIRFGDVIVTFFQGKGIDSSCSEEIRHSTIFDPKTGSYNTRYFQVFLDRELDFARRHAQPLTLIMFDIDHFKRVNDEHGSEAGDKVLETLAQLLAPRVRQVDLLARYSGEEFALVLTGTTLKEGVHFAEQVRRLVADTRFTFGGDQISVSISLGVASAINEPGFESATLVNHANENLREAKRRGRNQVVPSP